MAKIPIGGDGHVELGLPVDGIKFEADLTDLIRGVGSVPIRGSKTRLVYLGEFAMEIRRTLNPWRNSKIGMRVDDLDLFTDRLFDRGYSFSAPKDLEDETWTIDFQMYGGALKMHARGPSASLEEKKRKDSERPSADAAPSDGAARPPGESHPEAQEQ